jgi:hypothetical protein
MLGYFDIFCLIEGIEDTPIAAMKKFDSLKL